MSHYSRLQTTLRNKNCLIKALEDLGFKGQVEVHDTPVTLFGYRGDARPESAEIVLRRKHVGPASNDIGFKQLADGTWEAIISEYDANSCPGANRRLKSTEGLTSYNLEWQNRLTQYYAKNVVEEEAEAQGYTVAESEIGEDGQIYITIEG